MDIGGVLLMADNFKEAVCVDAGRVYDSCCDRDCLENLRLYFSPEDQRTVNCAIDVRARCATLLTTLVTVEPVTFNRGYYGVDMQFYFLVELDIYTDGCCHSTTVKGIATYRKKVILYGSEGNAKVFTSNTQSCEKDVVLPVGNHYPTAYVQAVDPVALTANICECNGNDCCVSLNAPGGVLATIGGCIADSESIKQTVCITLGLFTVVQLVRNVQMLMPVYDFCVPEKECVTTTDDACDIFSRIQFPLDEFFPPKESGDGSPGTCGGCEEDN
jgi:hypothetical protein